MGLAVDAGSEDGMSEGEEGLPAAPATDSNRRVPNILVTGTPGTGKTCFCNALASSCDKLRYVNVGEFVREKDLHDGWDDDYQCFIINEDKLLDELEEKTGEGGCLLDYHSCELFPERWFDLVIVLQTDNSVLYDRLTARGYSGKKLEDNMECEIMQVLLEEARDSYAASKVLPLESNSVEDMERNVERIGEWIKNWCSAHAG